MICRDTPTHGWVCGWLGESVGQWVGLGQMTKQFNQSWPNQGNSILFEDLWFLETPPPTPLPIGWVSGSMGQWIMDQMTKNLISLDLIEIIQFYLKIYDL